MIKVSQAIAKFAIFGSLTGMIYAALYFISEVINQM